MAIASQRRHLGIDPSDFVEDDQPPHSGWSGWSTAPVSTSFRRRRPRRWWPQESRPLATPIVGILLPTPTTRFPDALALCCCDLMPALVPRGRPSSGRRAHPVSTPARRHHDQGHQRSPQPRPTTWGKLSLLPGVGSRPSPAETCGYPSSCFSSLRRADRRGAPRAAASDPTQPRLDRPGSTTRVGSDPPNPSTCSDALRCWRPRPSRLR